MLNDLKIYALWLKFILREPPKTPTAKIVEIFKAVNDLKVDAFWLKSTLN